MEEFAGRLSVAAVVVLPTPAAGHTDATTILVEICAYRIDLVRGDRVVGPRVGVGVSDESG